jgi:hypothetical protein
MGVDLPWVLAPGWEGKTVAPLTVVVKNTPHRAEIHERAVETRQFIRYRTGYAQARTWQQRTGTIGGQRL